MNVRQELPALRAEAAYERDERTIARTEAAGLRRELMAALQVSFLPPSSPRVAPPLCAN